jgi:hypothetical protein
MKFYIEYGCGMGENSMIVSADNLDRASSFAYEKAIEEYETFEGLHGILDINDVCEEQGIDDIESDEAWEAYREEREYCLEYFAEEFDETKDEHVSALEEFGVWEI